MRLVTYTSCLMYLYAALYMTGCASFELETNQAGVSIIDEQGNRIGMAPYNFEQFSGERVFTLRKPGYVDKKITISSLDKKVIDVDLELVKETVLNTVPTDVRVVRTSDSTIALSSFFIFVLSDCLSYRFQNIFCNTVKHLR